jgi:hypothetical protein
VASGYRVEGFFEFQGLRVSGSQIGPSSYRYTGSRIRHLNPYPRNPTTEKTPKSLSGIIGAGRDQKSRIKFPTSNLGVELQSSERLKKCSQSSSAATLAAMLNTFYKTVFERSFARLWARAVGTGESISYIVE